MWKNELISIIIPTYKRSDLLERAIFSVLKQDYLNFEIVIVDDNASELEHRKCTKYVVEKLNNNRIKLINNKENLGGARSRNEGVKHASGKYICFLDDDDEYYENKLSRQLEYYKSIQARVDNLGMVYCQYDIYNSKNKYIGQTRNHYDGIETPFYQNMFSCIAGTPTWFMEKLTFEEIGGFEYLNSGQDWQLIIALLENNRAMYSMEDSLIKVNLHEGERISVSEKKISSLKGEILDLKKMYISRYPSKVQAEILAYHYLTIANSYKLKNKVKALSYFYKAFQLKPLSKLNLKFLLSLFLPRYIVEKIKK